MSIARALMPDPDLLLLDEPAANLDLGARETLVRDLAVLAAQPRPAAIVLVSHHVEEIPPGFDHALVLADGRVVAAGPLDEVLRDGALRRAFGLPIVVERATAGLGGSADAARRGRLPPAVTGAAQPALTCDRHTTGR